MSGFYRNARPSSLEREVAASVLAAAEIDSRRHARTPFRSADERFVSGNPSGVRAVNGVRVATLLARGKRMFEEREREERKR
jgi:hypothetical protein